MLITLYEGELNPKGLARGKLLQILKREPYMDPSWINHVFRSAAMLRTAGTRPYSHGGNESKHDVSG